MPYSGGGKEASEMTEKNDGLATVIGLITVCVCVAAIFDPRFRKFCLGLLCKL
jgi:hypothetical protein